jgi:predicted ATP-dependent serine protease
MNNQPLVQSSAALSEKSNWHFSKLHEEVYHLAPPTQPKLEPSRAETDRQRGYLFVPLGEILTRPEEKVVWLLDGMLPSGGLSILAGKPKAGKSTLARDLSLRVAQGRDFLARKTTRGEVLYVALEEKESEVRRHFSEMGAQGDEPIFIHVTGTPNRAVDQLAKVAQLRKPVLIVVDTLFRLVLIRDGNDYIQPTNALAPLLEIARQTGAHILCVHHMRKGIEGGADAILGSTGIVAAVDTAILMNWTENNRTIQTVQRYGSPLDESLLHFAKETRTFELGCRKEEAEIARFEERIEGLLSDEAEPQLESAILEHVEGRRGNKIKALRSLVKNGKVQRIGKGGKQDPYRYCIPGSCSQNDTPESEQGNKNPPQSVP